MVQAINKQLGDNQEEKVVTLGSIALDLGGRNGFVPPERIDETGVAVERAFSREFEGEGYATVISKEKREEVRGVLQDILLNHL